MGPILDPGGFIDGNGGILNIDGSSGTSWRTSSKNAKYNDQLALIAKDIKTPDANLSFNAGESRYQLDNQTRAEIMALVQGKDLEAATSLLNSAKQGLDPKFKARQATQHMYETLLDQPGSAQTRTASLLDAYKGKI
jgi:hypothetical protein